MKHEDAFVFPYGTNAEGVFFFLIAKKRIETLSIGSSISTFLIR